MPKQQVTIEVDVPDGWEIDAVIAQPIKCIAQHVQIVGNKSTEICSGQGSVNINCKRAWQWPEWLTAGWVAMDSIGKWYAFDFEPRIKSDIAWINQHNDFDLSLTTFEPPPCTDWRQSKRRRPT